MLDQMGGQGELAYYNFGQNSFHQAVIDDLLANYPDVQVTALTADFENSYSDQDITQLAQENPDLMAVWSDESSTISFGV
jgi:ABC-type sugar transport system substrate-binding protein